MKKVVINVCFGGFGLSHEAILHYAKLKGLTVYPEEGKFKFITYWTVPPNERMQPLPEPWILNPIEDRIAYNKKNSEEIICQYDIPRNDPALVQTIEELGDVANGKYAELKIVEIPDNVEWQIEEYGGTEHVAQKHETWS